jgi:hypothetical protein
MLSRISLLDMCIESFPLMVYRSICDRENMSQWKLFLSRVLNADAKRLERPIELMEYVVSVTKRSLSDEGYSELLRGQAKLGRFYEYGRRTEHSINLLEHVVAIGGAKTLSKHDYCCIRGMNY